RLEPISDRIFAARPLTDRSNARLDPFADLVLLVEPECLHAAVVGALRIADSPVTEVLGLEHQGRNWRSTGILQRVAWDEHQLAVDHLCYSAVAALQLVDEMVVAGDLILDRDLRAAKAASDGERDAGLAG